jgi:hypothetical protein
MHKVKQYINTNRLRKAALKMNIHSQHINIKRDKKLKNRLSFHQISLYTSVLSLKSLMKIIAILGI